LSPYLNYNFHFKRIKRNVLNNTIDLKFLSWISNAYIYEFGGLWLEKIVGKLVIISCDNNSVFQGHRTMMTLQFKDKVAPFVTKIHYLAHNTNLVLIILSDIPFGALVGACPTKPLCLFVLSLKKFIKFQKLANLL
jgi:hypothetical protein